MDEKTCTKMSGPLLPVCPRPFVGSSARFGAVQLNVPLCTAAPATAYAHESCVISFAHPPVPYTCSSLSVRAPARTSSGTIVVQAFRMFLFRTALFSFVSTSFARSSTPAQLPVLVFSVARFSILHNVRASRYGFCNCQSQQCHGICSWHD